MYYSIYIVRIVAYFVAIFIKFALSKNYKVMYQINCIEFLHQVAMPPA